VRGVTVIDDTYNANPDSMLAAIDVLAAVPGARWLALGDMGEVGDLGPAFHREIGAYARAAGIERLDVAGPLMREAAKAFGRGATHHARVEDLAGAVAAAARDGVTVLVKGSRFMRMERVVHALVPGAPDDGGHA
jgi:UDP-N-acetylmuramoyl-tripeptide--D-alanyl-D-alanine ligase